MKSPEKWQKKIILGMVAAYATLIGLQLAFVALTTQDSGRESRAFFLQHALRLAPPLIHEGRSREAMAYLNETVSTGLVDYYRWEGAGRAPVSQGKAPEIRPTLSATVSQHEGWVWGKADLPEGSLWIASSVGWRARLAAAVKTEAYRIFTDFFFLLSMGFGLLFYARKIRKLASAAPARLVSSPLAAARLVHSDATKPETGPSQPEEIHGICGRTALANYSELSAEWKSERFFAELDAFFTEGADLIDRYGGRVHAVQGHEILYYFPGMEARQQSRIALAAARDLEEIAAGRGLRLATALAHGCLHGGHVLSSFTLLGPPIEVTAELLQVQAGPDKNVIWVSAEIVKLCANDARFRTVPGEGRTGERHALVKLEDFHAVVTACRKGQCAELAFHRSDAVISALLTSLAIERDWSREAFVGVLNELGRFRCRSVGEKVLQAYRTLLRQEMSGRDSYRLSSVLALAPQLLRCSDVDSEMQKLFLSVVTVKDRRVRANAVQVFTSFFPERQIPELRPLVKDEDNRVSANALVKAALERLDDRVIARIEARVRGGSVAHVASALFALGEIAAYYRKHDPLFLGTKLSFLRIFNEIPAWVLHPNPMIRRQALQAARKLQDEELDAKLRYLFEQTNESDLAELFASVYGWHKEDKSGVKAA